jgi:hypothetical protein
MKVKVSTPALMAALLSTPLFAYPGFGGGKGLFRIQSAMVEQQAGLTVSLHALARNADFYTSEDAPNSSGGSPTSLRPS